MRRLAALASVVVAGLALAASGCGGDDDEASGTVPVDEWADGFCSAVSSWTDDLQEIRNRFQDLSSLSRESLEEAGQDASDATDRFTDELDGLGTPETESGQAIDDSIQTLTDTVESEKTDVEEAVEGIDSLNDIPSAISAVGSALSAMGTALQSTFDSLRDQEIGGELRTALEDSEACDDLTS